MLIDIRIVQDGVAPERFDLCCGVTRARREIQHTRYLVVAVTIAFLTGTTLLLVAAGAQTTAIADNQDSPGSTTYYEDFGAAQSAVGDDQAILPVAAVANGSTRSLMIGVPDGVATEIGRTDLRFRVGSGDTTTLGTIGASRTEREPSCGRSIRLDQRQIHREEKQYQKAIIQ